MSSTSMFTLSMGLGAVKRIIDFYPESMVKDGKKYLSIVYLVEFDDGKQGTLKVAGIDPGSINISTDETETVSWGMGSYITSRELKVAFNMNTATSNVEINTFNP